MRKIKGFCSLIDNMDLQNGFTAMLQAFGVGKMKPNILSMGFKNDWRTCDQPALDQYFATIQLLLIEFVIL
jgi:solute carrier family 12 sodium/potassium/chloride transporter 2